MADTSEPCPDKPGMTDDDLAQLATTPKKVVGDEGSVEEHSFTEHIALDRYRASAACGATKPPFGMYIASVRPKGTV